MHRNSERRSPFLFAWRHAVASPEVPNPIDRHVAMTLALYMDENGQSAWPSQDTIARRTGYTDRTVGRALERLYRGQWLNRQPRKSPKGRQHRRFGYEYWARLPAHLAEAYAKGERASLFNGQDELVNGERHDKRMANAVRTNTSVEYSTQGMLLRKRDLQVEGNATPAAKMVKERRAARDEFVTAIEEAEARERAKASATPEREIATTSRPVSAFAESV